MLIPVYIYIFRFRSYLVTDIGRILDAKGGFVNFLGYKHLMVMGSPQMGNFLSPSPFPYGDPHMEMVKPNG